MWEKPKQLLHFYSVHHQKSRREFQYSLRYRQLILTRRFDRLNWQNSIYRIKRDATLRPPLTHQRICFAPTLPIIVNQSIYRHGLPLRQHQLNGINRHGTSQQTLLYTRCHARNKNSPKLSLSSPPWPPLYILTVLLLSGHRPTDRTIHPSQQSIINKQHLPPTHQTSLPSSM